MAHWGMVIDVSKCVGCYSCFISCKDEHWGNDFAPYTVAQERHGKYWIDLVKRERGIYPYVKVAFMPLLCFHCDDAPCVRKAKNGAVYKRDDGIVIIDPVKAAGQKEIVDSCPWGVISWNEEKKVAQKCTFCVHKLENGEVPRCAQVCPSGCINFGDLDDPNSQVSKLLKSAKTKGYKAELDANAKPRVVYINVQKIESELLAGQVIFKDTDECAAGATVTLSKNGTTSTTSTNTFGNFEFDDLKPGDYKLKIESPGYKPASVDVKMAESTYLPDIFLAKA